MFCDVDVHMESSSSRLKECSLFAGDSLFNVAVLRREDSLGTTASTEASLNSKQTGDDARIESRGELKGDDIEECSSQRERIAFINFDGDPYENDKVKDEVDEGGEGEGEGGGEIGERQL